MSLTTADIKSHFKSNFKLALYAIALARYEITAGRETSTDQVLKLVRRHPDPSYLETLKEIDAIEEE